MPDDVAAPAAPAPVAPAAPVAPVTPATPAAPETPPSIIHEPAPPSGEPPPSYVNADGTFVPEWTSKLGAEFDDAKVSLSKYKNVGELVKAYQHANSLVGRKGIIPPTADSPPEEISRYREALGVPETPQAYSEEVKPKVELPPGVVWNDNIANEYFALAHKHNVPAAAMKELVALNLKQREFEIQAATNQLAERKHAATQALRQHWGANFDRNIDLARRAASKYGISQDDPGWASPEMVKGWIRAMADMGEDKLVGPGSSLPAGAADLRSRARDIQTNPQNPNYQKYWNGDPDVQAMVRDYLKKAGG